MYDFLLVGAGLFNAVVANELTIKGYKCAVLEQREHIGGNCYTYLDDDIVVHKYGAHIFRTDDKYVWDYINRFAEFNNFINEPIALFKGEVYNLPFNMNTFSRLWGISTPDEAKKIIAAQGAEINGDIHNLEEHAIKLVGRDVYEKLIKGYTEKQWGKSCTELPPSIMRRIPVRYTYNNNYYSARYQGIPIGGFTGIMDKMFSKCDIFLNTNFFDDRAEWMKKAKTVIFTGTIDAFYDYCYGELEYRSLRFETERLDTDNFQGNAVVNYTAADIPYTRIIEHKHFEFGRQKGTVISKEYSTDWNRNIEPYYPVNDERNSELYNKYSLLAEKEKDVIFGGRLGMYQYFDMQDTIKEALKISNQFL